MVKKRAAHSMSSMRTAVLFISIVSVALIVAVSIKVIHTIQRSIFDGQHQFITLLQTSPEHSTVVSVDPSNHSITIVYITNPKKENIEQTMSISFDTIVKTNSSIMNEKDVKDAFINSIFVSQDSQSRITWYDLARLYWLIRTTIKGNIQDIYLTLPTDPMQINQIQKSFVDNSITSENIPVQIINATGVTGIGNRLGNLLANSGYSVIDVRTNTTILNTSSIFYYNTISYSVQKLQRILHFPLNVSLQPGIAPIQIILGKDSINTTIF